MGFNLLDFFNIGYFAWINLGLLWIRLGRILVLGSSRKCFFNALVSFDNSFTLYFSTREKRNPNFLGNHIVHCNFHFEHVWNFFSKIWILNSVHTFANDPERGLFILIFLFALIFLSLFIFFFFHQTSKNNSSNFFWLSKETSILVNNWFMMYFLSVVLIGTVYPIFLDVISSQKISVGPPFYHKLIAPFLIPFLFAMAIGPRLKWIRSDLKDKIYLISY